MNIIVAVDNNFAIGANNNLLYTLPKDLQFFKQKTLNKVVVMGYNTLLSLPKQKPLNNRTNIVIWDKPTKDIPNATVVTNLPQLFAQLKKYNSNDIYIIGGAYVYAQLLPYCDTAYITKINATTSGATKFFPNVDTLKNWQLTYTSEPFLENNLSFCFTTYQNNLPLKQ